MATPSRLAALVRAYRAARDLLDVEARAWSEVCRAGLRGKPATPRIRAAAWRRYCAAGEAVETARAALFAAVP
jgi:Ser/Thr protein kinase RdoA (MazF antagonist)